MNSTDQEGQALVHAEVKDLHDVGMAELGGVHGFCLEPLGHRLLLVRLRACHLEGNLPLQHLIRSSPDITHSSRSHSLQKAKA